MAANLGTAPIVIHIRAISSRTVQPRFLTDPCRLADRLVGFSVPGGALSQSQQCSGRQLIASGSGRGRSGPVTRGVASDG